MEALIESVKQRLQQLKNNTTVSPLVYRQAHSLYLNGQSQLLAQSKDWFEFSVDGEFNDYTVKIPLLPQGNAECNCQSDNWCQHKIASLMQLLEHLTRHSEEPPQTLGKAYTRQGMIKRVLAERHERAASADYPIEFDDNPHGEHLLTNEKGQKYRITFRNFEKETGYCSCPDYETNKLGTCKHLIYAFGRFKKPSPSNVLRRYSFPFVEIFLDPLNDYRISWFFPDDPGYGVKRLLQQYFKGRPFIPDDEVIPFLGFIQQAAGYKQILIRPDVLQTVERAYNRRTLDELQLTVDVRPHLVRLLKDIKLFDYQVEGVRFATFREGAIIADEMGLGKTLQAIGTAVVKKQLFDFKRTLVICPVSLKEQWKNEIERYTNEKAVIAESGQPDERHALYADTEAYFIIVSYETVIRDVEALNRHAVDFIILDEAQRIRNYETQTAQAIQALEKRHAMVITGTPLESRLIDLYSVVNFVDNRFLTPLWEFSYQHCYFDDKQTNKITGYFNLQQLKQKLSAILIRREKQEVIRQLPNISHLDVPVEMHPRQIEFHAQLAANMSVILAKKYLTPFDLQQIMQLLAKMRMVCNSTYLVDLETNYSPKLKELEYILLEKINIKTEPRKVIIFSEWKRMINIISKMLRDNQIGYVELTGSVAPERRGELMQTFETDNNCKVFVATEAGGTGLNLQVADTLINFDLPWRPTRKSQRLGRIDRIGQRSKNLTVINLIAKDSIEISIAEGLEAKQSLFDSVLDSEGTNQTIDASEQNHDAFVHRLTQFTTQWLQAHRKHTRKHTPNNDDNQPKLDFLPVTPEAALRKQSDKLPDTKTVTENTTVAPSPPPAELQSVMQNGIQFLAGMYRLATGNELKVDDSTLHINPDTREVTFRFKF